MLSRNSVNRKRGQNALVNVTNVHQNNKRIKLDQYQNIPSISCKRTNLALSSIGNVPQSNNKRIKLCNELQPKQGDSCLSTQCTSRPLHLNHLPFDCLSGIFDRISLQQRITRLSLVCRHWKSTVDEMCLLKGQLTINLFSNYKPTEFEFMISDLETYRSNERHERMESLLLKPKNKCSLPDLSVRFPLVTQLVIRSNDTTERQNCASLRLFLSLLGQQQQCSSLTSLTLYKLTNITDPTFLPQLCSVINQKASNLTQLNLYLQSFGAQTCESHPERVMLNNILPQLERFFVICSFKNWFTVMRTLGTPTSECIIKELDLCEDRLSPDNLSRLLTLTRFTTTVTHLHLTAIHSRAWFSIICDNFGLLQFLQINIGYIKFNADWFTDLSKLSHLTELKMHDFQLDLSAVKIVPLPTVKKLTICNSGLLTQFRASTGSNRFNASQYCRLMSHHFPSVSVLILLSNEKSVTMAEKNIRKWVKVHFKQIEKVVLVLKAEEYRNDMRVRKKFMREYRKTLGN